MSKPEKNIGPLPWTGERYVPEIKGTIALEHMHRYNMARELAVGKIVLDVACGEGYGTAHLAEVATRVFGVDVSADTVEHACQKYKKDNLEFRVGSCAQIPLPDSSIDLVVSFETIEHHDQHDAMMAEIKRVLCPDGMIVISSPEKYEYSILPDHKNPFHVKELHRHEFEQLMGTYFRHVAMYGQRVIYGSGILREDSLGPIVTYEGIHGSPHPAQGMRRPIYLIALGSDVPLPVSASSLFEEHLSKSDAVLAVVAERDAWVADRDAQISTLARRLTERDRKIVNLNQLVSEKDKQLQTILDSRSWQITRPLREMNRLIGVNKSPGIYKVLRAILPRVFAGVRRNGIQALKGNGSQASEIERSGLFDKEWYLTQNPEISASHMDPLAHYVNHGASKGYSPNPLFNPSIYVAFQKGSIDLRDALLHFYRSGLQVAPGAYRTADVLISVQHDYRRNTRMRFIRDQRSSKAKFAVYLQCGSGSIHEQWLKGNHQTWDLIVNHYDASYVGNIPCEVEFQQIGSQPGTKFTSFFTLVRSYQQVIEKYDHLLLLDDDIYIEEDQITHLFESVQRNSLDLAQASLTPDSDCAHPICRNAGTKGLRFVNTAEIMMPIISRKALEVGAHLFAQTISGWGLDVSLGKLLATRFSGRAAIIDTVMARHTKTIDTQNGAFYRMLYRANIYPEIELAHMQKMYKAGREIYEIATLPSFLGLVGPRKLI